MINSSNVEIGERIFNLRKNLRLSQEELAERADTSKQTISRAEKGQQELLAGSIARISEGLGVSADYLLKGLPSNSDLVLLDDRIQKLNKDQYKFLSELINNFIDFCELSK